MRRYKLAIVASVLLAAFAISGVNGSEGQWDFSAAFDSGFAAVASAETSGAATVDCPSSSTLGPVGTNLQLSWQVKGVGGGTKCFTGTATNRTTYQCINGGGNNPQASNKSTVEGPVAGGAVLLSQQNGTYTGINAIKLAPLPPSISCPSGQQMYMVAVSYTNVQVHIPSVGANSPILAGPYSKSVFIPIGP